MASTSRASHKELTDGEISGALHIQGNLSEKAKRHCLGVFNFYVSTPGNSFGADLGGRLKLVEASVYAGRANTSISETVFEVEITRGITPSALTMNKRGHCSVSCFLDMCNIFKILHGACAAYIVDLLVFKTSSRPT